MTADGDYYDRLAEAAEAADVTVNPLPEGAEGVAEPPPAVASHEATSRGPVIIDTVTGAIRDARSGEVLVEPTPAPTERELDLSLIAMALFFAACLLALLAVALSPLTASQRLGLAALVFVLAAERLWYEIRRNSTDATAPEGVVYYASQQEDASGRGPFGIVEG